MKISSASKKVLASALSAAMVVAFAPTAFGQTITDPSAALTPQTVKVTYLINGGSIVASSGYSALANETAPVYYDASTQKTYIKVSVASGGALDVNTTIAQMNGVAPDEWFVDEDGDGILDAGEYGVNSSYTYLEVAPGTTEVELKAHYATASVSSGGVFTASAIADNEQPTLGNFSVKGLTAGSYYTATLADPSGTVIASSAVHNATDSNNDAWAAIAYDNKKVDSSYKFAKGDYVFSITEVGKTTPTLTKTFTLVELTFDAGVYGSFSSDFDATRLINKGDSLDSTQIAGPSTPGSIVSGNKLITDGGYTFQGWVANGAAVTASDGVKPTKFEKDTTLTATYNNPRVSSAAFTANTFLADGKATLRINASDLVSDGIAGAAAEGVHYQVTVSGPNGFSKVIAKTDETNKVAISSAGAITNLDLTFGAAYEGFQATTAKLEAGTYTVSIAAVADEGYALTEAQKAPIASKSVSVAAITYDMAGAEWKDAATAKSATNNQPVLAVAGTSINSILGNTTTNISNTKNLLYGLANGNLKFAGELQQIDYITVDGVKSNKITTEKVSAEGVKVALVTKESKAALPEVSFAASGDKYVATVVPATGTTVKVNRKALAADGKITLAASDTLTIDVTEGTKTNTVTYYGPENNKGGANTNAVYVVGAWATDVANATTSVSTANAPVRYGATLTTLKADAVAAIKAIGFAKGADWDKAWGKAVLEQKKAVLEKAAAVELANIEAAKALVKGADGKYTYVSAAEADKAIAAVNAVVADFVGLNAVQNGELKSYIATSKYGTPGTLVIASDNGSTYAAALKQAATCATIKVEAAVAEPVIAVNKQLAAAKTADEAKAAIEAFNKLTAEQKAMVSAADVAAAEEIIAAAELKDAQDETAVAKARSASKTVKAGKNGKTTKKQSVTLKKITSKSGAKVTYKKVSGKKVITVKSGKAYLAKGVKKGTYKATVKATCGTQTAKIKVTFKVK